jgi:TPR repeat protein
MIHHMSMTLMLGLVLMGNTATAELPAVCKTGPAEACHAWAVQHREADCQSGDGRACLVLANVYRLGFYVAVDTTKAGAFYQKAATLLDGACRGDDGQSCAMLAELYEWGRGVAKDHSHADALAQRAQGLTPVRAVAEDGD